MRNLRAPFTLGISCSCVLWVQAGSANAQFVLQRGNLVGTGEVGYAQQGTSVAVSADGSTAIVGGPGDGCVDTAYCTGAAWVFTRSGGVWTQQGNKLVGTGAIGKAGQGISVALSGDGNTALVGGYGDNDNAGGVWVFTRSAGVWAQQGGKLVGTGAKGLLNGGTSSVYQGFSVALSSDGNTAIFGGPGDGYGIPSECLLCGVGAAWVFTRSGTVWSASRAASSLAPMVGLQDREPPSRCRAMEAQRWSEDRTTAATGGATWVFSRSGQHVDAARQRADRYGSGSRCKRRTGCFSRVGRGMRNTAIVSAPFDNAGHPITGAVWVFTRSGGIWTQQGNKLAAGDGFGLSLALSSDGKTALIGVYGGADILTRTGSTWSLEGGELAAAVSYGGSNAGASVALSADGGTAVIGAPQGERSDYEPQSRSVCSRREASGSLSRARTRSLRAAW